ncbi:glycosyltransferase [Kocuria rosea]|uniref:glycosyltransferase n=1 Tax=Kocuria rosea TaxID=1275 RepID=UPI00301A3E41
MTATVVIVQPYVPTYRVPFFDGLRRKLADFDIECLVAAGAPQGAQAQRGDSAHPDWLIPINEKTINFKGREVTLALSPTPWRNVDAVIMGLEGSSLPVYQALFACKARNMRFGLWGHVRPYVTPGNSLDLWLEKHQMQNADQIFAYMPGGTRFAINNGINPWKITTVMNTVDTDALASAIENVTDRDIEEFADINKFDPARTVCFLGGLDASKRINFLAESLERLWELDPSLSLLVAGQGKEEDLLKKAYARGQAHPVGYADTKKKALVLKSTRAVCMPGRIGLVAVDALVAGSPIITTDWPFHAPEIEYLGEGTSRITAPNNPIAYAEMILDYVEHASGFDAFDYPKLDTMIDNFAHGVMKMLS